MRLNEVLLTFEYRAIAQSPQSRNLFLFLLNGSPMSKIKCPINRLFRAKKNDFLEKWRKQEHDSMKQDHISIEEIAIILHDRIKY